MGYAVTSPFTRSESFMLHKVTPDRALSPPTAYVRYHTPLTVMQVMEVIGRSSERKDPRLSVYPKLDFSQGGQV